MQVHVKLVAHPGVHPWSCPGVHPGLRPWGSPHIGLAPAWFLLFPTLSSSWTQPEGGAQPSKTHQRKDGPVLTRHTGVYFRLVSSPLRIHCKRNMLFAQNNGKCEALQISALRRARRALEVSVSQGQIRGAGVHTLRTPNSVTTARTVLIGSCMVGSCREHTPLHFQGSPCGINLYLENVYLERNVTVIATAYHA